MLIPKGSKHEGHHVVCTWEAEDRWKQTHPFLWREPLLYVGRHLSSLQLPQVLAQQASQDRTVEFSSSCPKEQLGSL